MCVGRGGGGDWAAPSRCKKLTGKTNEPTTINGLRRPNLDVQLSDQVPMPAMQSTTERRCLSAEHTDWYAS